MFEWFARAAVWLYMMTTAASTKAAQKTARLAARQARLVAKLERAYAQAIRAEENAATLPQAYRLAAVSERCLRDLEAARAGRPLPERKVPATLRNRAKQALGVLATIGRTIARAVQAAAALRKAQAVNAARRAARLAARLAHAAMRRALRSIVSRLTVTAPTTKQEILVMRAPTLARGIYTTNNHVGLDSTVTCYPRLLRTMLVVDTGIYRELRVQLRGDRLVFSGGFQGEHSLAADELITNAARLLAHWKGYVNNNAEYVENACAGYFTRAALIERCVGGAS